MVRLELVRTLLHFFHQSLQDLRSGEHVISNIVTHKHLFLEFLSKPASQHIALVFPTQQSGAGTVWPWHSSSKASQGRVPLSHPDHGLAPQLGHLVVDLSFTDSAAEIVNVDGAGGGGEGGLCDRHFIYLL